MSLAVAHQSGFGRGSFLLKRRIYQNTAGKAFLCLGFHTYAAIGYPLEKAKVKDKDKVCQIIGEINPPSKKTKYPSNNFHNHIKRFMTNSCQINIPDLLLSVKVIPTKYYQIICLKNSKHITSLSEPGVLDML